MCQGEHCVCPEDDDYSCHHCGKWDENGEEYNGNLMKYRGDWVCRECKVDIDNEELNILNEEAAE